MLDTMFLHIPRTTVHHTTGDMVMAATVGTAMVDTEVMDASIAAPYIRSGVKHDEPK